MYHEWQRQRNNLLLLVLAMTLPMNVVDTSLCSSLAGASIKGGTGPKKTLIWTLYYKLQLKF
jgi:hypothetical protein